MVKEDINNLKIEDIFYKGQYSTIYRLIDQRLLKVIVPEVEEIYREYDTSYEERVLDTRAKVVEEIVAPLSVVYNHGICCGYTMEEVNGMSLPDYCDNLFLCSNENLNIYSELYTNVENVVRKANENGIVIPDLCTAGNIMVQNDGKIRLIDYDGLQIKDNISVCLSSALGNPKKYISATKFRDRFYHFTDELDKASLAILLFILVFNLDISRIGQYYPGTNIMVTTKDVFDMLGCSDVEFMKNIDDNLSVSKLGHYLADDLKRIASDYVMVPFSGQGAKVTKRLIRK